MVGRRARVLKQRLRYAGRRVRCPCCNRRFGRFIVGDYPTQVICPGCGSRPRQRLLCLYLERRVGARLGELSVLHVAPEHSMANRLHREAGRYVSVDLSEERSPSVVADITSLPFDVASFDLVLCSHVLEHVPSDRAAMREMLRVLRPGGEVLVQSPVNYDQRQTFEDPQVTSPQERARLFSQDDHVRVYGRDLGERLEEVGFEVVVHTSPSDPGAGRCGLVPAHGPLRNEIYICRHPVGP